MREAILSSPVALCGRSDPHGAHVILNAAGRKRPCLGNRDVIVGRPAVR